MFLMYTFKCQDKALVKARVSLKEFGFELNPLNFSDEIKLAISDYWLYNLVLPGYCSCVLDRSISDVLYFRIFFKLQKLLHSKFKA